MSAAATETAAPAVDSQWICDPTKADVCGCAGEQYSCDCERNEVTNICRTCLAPMIEIEVDSGEPVEAVAS